MTEKGWPQVGDRVAWRYPEPGAEPEELVGTVVERIAEGSVKVRWDDGETEEEDINDLME